MDKKESYKNKIKIATVILAVCLILIYVLSRLFAKMETEHVIHEALSPYFLRIGKLEIRWYAVCILSGAIMVAFIAYYGIFRYVKFDSDNLLTGLIWGLFSGVLGARIYYIIFEHESLPSNFFAAFKEIIGLGPNGLSGLAIHGAIYSTVIFLIIFCKVKKIKLLPLIEIVLPCFMLAQVVGRWGNFFNQEAFGTLVNGYTEGPLTEAQLLAQRLTLKRFLVPDFVINNMYITPNSSLDIPMITGYYYPTFYFESVLNFIGVITYMILRRKSKKIYLGDAVAFYLTWYGIVRFIIESLRTDPLMIGNIRVALLTSIIFFVGGIAIFILRRVFKYRLEPVKDFFKNGTMWKDETYDPFIEIEERKRLEREKREARKNKKDMNKDEQ